jgi:chorismate mutase
VRFLNSNKMKYINKNTGDSISEAVYSQLNETAKDNFIQAEDVVNKTHTVVETKSDNLSIGDAVAVVVLSPVILFKSLFG